ncbi:MAG: hypothetical protein O3C45_11195 [Bacteroidetes bacterium]|nr:hypothetical protein [Bacteroidota bacterium]
MQIRGIIVHEDIEGGFWGIQAGDGKRYLPVNPIPETLRKQGQAVLALLKPVQMLGAFQWGEPVQIESIEAAR